MYVIFPECVLSISTHSGCFRNSSPEQWQHIEVVSNPKIFDAFKHLFGMPPDYELPIVSKNFSPKNKTYELHKYDLDKLRDITLQERLLINPLLSLNSTC